ncbi:MAG: hypothetical protein ACQESR_25990 [Planctomycetota bacterium]
MTKPFGVPLVQGRWSEDQVLLRAVKTRVARGWPVFRRLCRGTAMAEAVVPGPNIEP